MPISDDDTGEKPIQVVLRFARRDGVVDMTDIQTLDAEKNSIRFNRDEEGNIGKPLRYAFVTWVIPLGEGEYCLDDVWLGHAFRLDGDEESIGLGFRDIFTAHLLEDGSLQFDKVLVRGNWRVISWLLGPPVIRSPLFAEATSRIEEHGGFAEEDPAIGGLLWIFLPPDTDYDPEGDVDEAVRMIRESGIS